MYSTDYPHSVTLWPNSRELIPKLTADLSRRRRRGRCWPGTRSDCSVSDRSRERVRARRRPTVVPEPDVKAALRSARRDGAAAAVSRPRTFRTRSPAPPAARAEGVRARHRAQDRPRCGARSALAARRARRRGRRHAARGCRRHGITPAGFLVEEQRDGRRRRRADRRRRAARAVRARRRARPRRHAHRAARPRRGAHAPARGARRARARRASSPARPRSAGSAAGRRSPAEALVAAPAGARRSRRAGRAARRRARRSSSATRCSSRRPARSRSTPASCCATHPPRPSRRRSTDFTRLVRAARDRGRRRVDDAQRLRQPRRSPRTATSAGTTHLYALHPDADARSTACPRFADVADMPTSRSTTCWSAVPAPRCADVVRATAGRVPFVHVISGGFDEVGADGAALSQGLLDAAREVKTRVVGPNCIGVYSPAGRQTFQLNAPRDVGPRERRVAERRPRRRHHHRRRAAEGSASRRC